MSVVSLQEYRELIVRSGLLGSDAVQEQFSSFSEDTEYSASETPEDGAASFAKHLESSGLLTQWQNANLLRGRFRGLMFGKFRVLRMLGAGGMGRVFLAENQMLKRKVALKVLPKKLSKFTFPQLSSNRISKFCSNRAMLYITTRLTGSLRWGGS